MLAGLSADAAAFLGNAALATLRIAAANPATLIAGFVLIARNSNLRVAGDVPEIPGLRYAWNRDEATLHLTYQGEHGTRDIRAMLGADGLFHDGGRVVARLLPDHTLAIDPGEISSDLADKDGPNLCPTPGLDKPGRTGSPGEKDRDYEDQIKLLVNPDNPTPRGYGYQFFDPTNQAWVYIDDCQHKTGLRVEIKGDYSGLLSFDAGRGNIVARWLDQSYRQVQVSDGFGLMWVFAQKSDADFARALFSAHQDGRERIDIQDVPRVGGVK